MKIRYKLNVLVCFIFRIVLATALEKLNLKQFIYFIK